jgi:hypothetical protein
MDNVYHSVEIGEETIALDETDLSVLDMNLTTHYDMRNS